MEKKCRPIWKKKVHETKTAKFEPQFLSKLSCFAVHRCLCWTTERSNKFHFNKNQLTLHSYQPYEKNLCRLTCCPQKLASCLVGFVHASFCLSQSQSPGFQSCQDFPFQYFLSSQKLNVSRVLPKSCMLTQNLSGRNRVSTRNCSTCGCSNRWSGRGWCWVSRLHREEHSAKC